MVAVEDVADELSGVEGRLGDKDFATLGDPGDEALRVVDGSGEVDECGIPYVAVEVFFQPAVRAQLLGERLGEVCAGIVGGFGARCVWRRWRRSRGCGSGLG